MTDPFSVAAGSFAVVGVADVVLRAGKDFCQFLRAIQDAPTEVESLRCCIEDAVILVQDLRRYWQELKQSDPSTSSSAASLNQALPQFQRALRTFDRELSSLLTLAKRYKGSSKRWAMIKWVLDERKILKSLQNLEVAKTTLGVALVLVGR